MTGDAKLLHLSLKGIGRQARLRIPRCGNEQTQDYKEEEPARMKQSS
jgi:hypothetical protein